MVLFAQSSRPNTQYCAFFVSTTCIILAFLLVSAFKRRLTVKIIDDASRSEATPAFLLPREHSAQAIPASRGGPRVSASLIVKPPLEVRHEIMNGAGRGVLLRCFNSGIEPLEKCQLIVVSFASFHTELGKYRRPTFEPLGLISIKKLEPDEASSEAWLARANKDMTAIKIPSGKPSQFHEVKSAGRWRATLRVRVGELEYKDELDIQWQPGSIPTVVPLIQA